MEEAKLIIEDFDDVLFQKSHECYLGLIDKFDFVPFDQEFKYEDDNNDLE